MKRAICKIRLSLSINGNADSELHIKGFTNIEIGDWTHDLDAKSDQFADVNYMEDNHAIEFVAYEQS